MIINDFASNVHKCWTSMTWEFSLWEDDGFGYRLESQTSPLRRFFLCSVKNCFAARRQKSTWRGMSNGILWFFEIPFKFSLNFLGAGSVILPQTNISNDWTLQRTLLTLVVIVICDVFFRFTWQSRLVGYGLQDFNWKKIVLVELRGWNPLSCSLWDFSWDIAKKKRC